MSSKKPVQYTDTDVYALKALAEGKATSGQQQTALRFFLNVSGVRDEPRAFENPIEQGFDSGKRFVGWTVARLIELVGITSPATNTKDS